MHSIKYKSELILLLYNIIIQILITVTMYKGLYLILR